MIINRRETVMAPAISLLIPRNHQGRPHIDLGPELNAVFWFLTILALVFLVTRIYCKFYRGRSLWWDDHLLVASWVALATAAATTSVCVALDYGKPFEDMRKENLPKMPFVSVFAGFFSVLAVCWSKTSFALTLVRLAEGWPKRAIWFMIVSLNIVLGAAMFSMWTKCIPFTRVWDKSVRGACLPEKEIVVFYQFTAGYSGALDIILALFPWPIVWKIKTNTREKVGIALAMSMGILAGIASFVKMAKLPLLATGDATDSVSVSLWGAAEGAITIMAASIPVLRMLFRKQNGQSSLGFRQLNESGGSKNASNLKSREISISLNSIDAQRTYKPQLQIRVIPMSS